MDLIRIENATAWRGQTRVFDQLSLSIPSGQNTAVIGPNGSGKSTLLRLITRQTYPNPGNGCMIEILGQRRWNVWQLRTQLGIVSQDMQRDYRDDVCGLDVVASGVFSSVGIPDHLKLNEAQRNRVDQLIDYLGVNHLRDRAYSATSTGEQRRLLLARALVHDPHTLIFDEPTAGLDVSGIFQYLKTARSLMQSGKTIVVVTHHLHEIPPEITHLVLMKDGSVLAAGPKHELMTDAMISELFGVRVKVIETDGFYQVGLVD